MPDVRLAPTENIKTILLVSDRPLNTVLDAAARKGIETKQVFNYKDFMKTPLDDWSICITNMLPVWSQWRLLRENSKSQPELKKVKKGTLDGWEVLAQCSKRNQPVAVYTDRLSPTDEIATYAEGSIGCFQSTSVTAVQLIKNLTQLMRSGEIYIDDRLSYYDKNTLICRGDDIFAGLQQSEIDVIVRLVSGHSYARICEDLNVIDGTLRNKISKMLSTVVMASREDLIQHALQIGVVELDDDELPENLETLRLA